MKGNRKDAWIRKVLRMIRVGAGLTTEELATRVNVDRSYISRVESGHLPVSYELMLEWLSACGGNTLLSWAIESFQALQTFSDLSDDHLACV